MRACSFARAAIAAAVSSLVVVGLSAHAQQPEGTRLPADLVADLIAAPDAPGGRARLAAHFLAVAAEYDTQAREHGALAEAYRRAPTGSETKRPASPDTAVHCDRLADRAAAAATEARTLAVAFGSSAPPAPTPAATARETASATPSSPHVLEATEPRRLAKEAPNPESHARLEHHYLALAAKLDREAREHRHLAAAYRAAPGASDAKRPGAPDTAVHCERLAELVSRMAAEARALASSHAQQQGGR